MMGLLHHRSFYDKNWPRFYDLVPVKTVFAYLRDTSVPIGDASINDAMTPWDCTVICGRVYYSGRNVTSSISGVGTVTFYKDSKGALHDATDWLRETAVLVARFR